MNYLFNMGPKIHVNWKSVIVMDIASFSVPIYMN